MQYISRNTQQKPNMAQLLIYTPGINIYKHITQLENTEGICENTGKLRCAMSVASEKMSALRQRLERSTGFPVYVQQQYGPDSEHMAGA